MAAHGFAGGAIAFAALALQAAHAVRCGVEEGRPEAAKRRALPDVDAQGNLQLRAVTVPAVKTVRWSEDIPDEPTENTRQGEHLEEGSRHEDEEPQEVSKQHAEQPEEGSRQADEPEVGLRQHEEHPDEGSRLSDDVPARPDLGGSRARRRRTAYNGQEGRFNPHFARDMTAHRLARSFGRIPRLLSRYLRASPVADDTLEPLPFRCGGGAGQAFANTLADHVLQFTDTPLESVARRFGELFVQCPYRCVCLERLLLAGNDTRPSMCSDQAFDKFSVLKRQERFRLLHFVRDSCQDRCICLAEVQHALARRAKLEEAPHSFAVTLLHTGPAASMAVLDAWATLGMRPDAQPISRHFAHVVARVLGPHVVLATDVLALWVRSRGGRTLSLVSDIYKFLIYEEVHEAFYLCKEALIGMPCVLRAWPRSVAHKCNDGLVVLAAQALAALFKTKLEDARKQVQQYCREEASRQVKATPDSGR